MTALSRVIEHDNREPRVFWPGDTIPAGLWVYGRDGRPIEVWHEMTVPASQPYAFVELVIPDYDRKVEHAWGRRWAREEVSS